jgi:hypothetical protein
LQRWFDVFRNETREVGEIIEMAIFELELSFFADLTTFLRRDSRDQGLIRRMLAEKTAVKARFCRA